MTNTIDNILIDVDIIFKERPSVELKTTARSAALNGSPIYGKGTLQDIELIDEETNISIYCDDEFLGIGVIKYSSEDNRKYIKIEKMFV